MTRGNQRDRDRVRAANRHDRNHKEAVSQLKQIDKSLSIICKICKMAFMCTTNEVSFKLHCFFSATITGSCFKQA